MLVCKIGAVTSATRVCEELYGHLPWFCCDAEKIAWKLKLSGTYAGDGNCSSGDTEPGRRLTRVPRKTQRGRVTRPDVTCPVHT